MASIRRFVLVFLMAATGAQARSLVEVSGQDNGSKASLTDLSGTGLTRGYCHAEGKECPGTDITAAKFAPTARQCTVRCSQSRDCLSVFYDADRQCHLRGERCTTDQLQDAPGATNYYRLKEGESCPTGQPEYIEHHKKFSGKFCMLTGKSCPGHGLYRKPQNIEPYEECLKKCARIKTCAGVDYKDGKCDPKSYMCSDDELVPDPGMQNFMRLEEGVDQCPSNRGPPPDPEVADLGSWLASLDLGAIHEGAFFGSGGLKLGGGSFHKTFTTSGGGGGGSFHKTFTTSGGGGGSFHKTFTTSGGGGGGGSIHKTFRISGGHGGSHGASGGGVIRKTFTTSGGIGAGGAFLGGGGGGTIHRKVTTTTHHGGSGGSVNILGGGQGGGSVVHRKIIMHGGSQSGGSSGSFGKFIVGGGHAVSGGSSGVRYTTSGSAPSSSTGGGTFRKVVIGGGQSSRGSSGTVHKVVSGFGSGSITGSGSGGRISINTSGGSRSGGFGFGSGGKITHGGSYRIGGGGGGGSHRIVTSSRTIPGATFRKSYTVHGGGGTRIGGGGGFSGFKMVRHQSSGKK